MIDRSPILNRMSVKQRAKHYDALVISGNTGSTDMTKKRGKSYVGQPLAKQSADHKAPTMTKRGKKYIATSTDIHPYAVNSEFTLKIGGYTIKCSKISNLTMEQPIDEVMEGGNNVYPNVFIGKNQKSGILVIERALVEDNVAYEFKPGVYVGECTISIKKNNNIYKELGFDEGIITKSEFSNLDAMGSEIIIQKLEIAHSGLYTW